MLNWQATAVASSIGVEALAPAPSDGCRSEMTRDVPPYTPPTRGCIALTSAPSA